MSRHWLLEVVIGGRTYRWADVALTVTRLDGTVLDFAGYGSLADLEVQIGEGPVNVALDLPGQTPDGLDWCDVVQTGVDLAAGSAQLARWTEATAYEQRRQVVVGRVCNPEYGTAEEPLSISIERAPWDETATVPPASQKFSERTWPITSPGPVVDPAVYGVCYPWVFGYPGREGNGLIFGTLSFETPATPAYIGETAFGTGTGWRSNKLVIAGHAVKATSVRITDVSGGYGRIDPSTDLVAETLPVLSTKDLLGQTVAYIDLNAATVIAARPGNEYWTSWYSTTGGGHEDATGQGVMRGAGDIIEYLLGYAGVPVDHGRMAAAKARLNSLLLDVAITEPTRPQDWIESEIGDLVPLLRRESAEGLWYELANYEPSERDVRAHLVSQTNVLNDAAGVPCTRDTRLKYSDPARVENELTIRYCPRHGGEFCRTVTYSGKAAPVVASGERGSWLLGVSATRYGSRPRTIEARAIADAASANRVGVLRAEAYALPFRTVGVTVDGDFEGAPNDIVQFSDVELGIARVLARVASTTLRLTGDSFALELLDDPGRRRANAAPVTAYSPPDVTAPGPMAPDWATFLATYGPFASWIARASDVNGGAYVTQWSDSSGGGRHMNVVFGTNPVYEASSSALADQPSVVINNGYLQTTATDFDFTDFSVVTVWIDSSAIPGEFGPTGSGWPTAFYQAYEATNDFTMGAVIAGYPYGQISTVAHGVAHCTAFTRSGSVQKTYVGGTETNSAALSATQLAALAWKIGGGIGGGTSDDMRVACVFVWSRVLSPTEITAIQAFMAAAYGV